MAAQSRLANFQHCHQLEPGGGADQYRDLRRVDTTLISFQPFTTTSIGTLQFNSDAPAYFFATSDGLFTSISVTGAGIVDNSANAPTFIVGNQANLSFRNASTAGDATIITNAGGITIFADSATGGNARLIANAGGVFDISSLSTGGMTAGSIEGGEFSNWARNSSPSAATISRPR